MIPFTTPSEPDFAVGDYILVRGIRKAVTSAAEQITAEVIKPDGTHSPLALSIPAMTAEERQIILDGCLINHYRNEMK